MAHHNSTPQTVLDAPEPRTWSAFQPTHPNRQQRRQGGRVSSGRNTPYVRSAPRRGKRVKRHPMSTAK